MSRIREMLKTHNIRPRKGLGQSFLEDMNVVRRIAALADPQKDETIIEIGAGLGFLTEELARQAGRVIALEIDPRLLSILQDRFAGQPSVEIVAGDVLQYDFSAADRGGGIKVVGNIPYHISTPILFQLLRYRCSLTSLVLMMQKELADRIMALPGGKEYGIPSVLFSRHMEISRVLTVPPTCFYPVPEVVSSVLRFVVRQDLPPGGQDDAFARTVHAAFAQRRKTLRNNLRAAGVAPDTLQAVFQTCSLDGSRRAETLSVADFERLATALHKSGGSENLLDNRRQIW